MEIRNWGRTGSVFLSSVFRSMSVLATRPRFLSDMRTIVLKQYSMLNEPISRLPAPSVRHGRGVSSIVSVVLSWLFCRFIRARRLSRG